MNLTNLLSVVNSPTAVSLLQWARARSVLQPTFPATPRNAIKAVVLAQSPATVEWMLARCCVFGFGQAMSPANAVASPTPQIYIGGAHKEPHIKLREDERLCSFTRYTSDEWAIMHPDIYNTIQWDGRSKETVRDILQEAFTIFMDSSPAAAHLHATDDHVLDVKNLNFGQDDDLNYARCTRGLTILACLPVSTKQLEAEAANREVQKQLSFVTREDIISQKKYPTIIPTEFLEVLDLLAVYLLFGKVLMTEVCGNFIRVGEILTILRDQSCIRRLYSPLDFIYLI